MLFFLAFGVGETKAATRIFYEDCEATTYSEHFLERSYGTGDLSYWNEFKDELHRAENSPHGGNYSMLYNPFVDFNPHAVVGYGGADYGNTSAFDLSSYNNRYWYFRWYQKWESGATYTGTVKLIYINYATAGDFTVFWGKRDNDSFMLSVKDRATYEFVFPEDYKTFSGGVDDNEWHKMEMFIDAGTTGNANGAIWVKIDDIILHNHTGVTFNSTINPNPMEYLTGWPSNWSGTETPGSQDTWLDDLEIYTLTGSDDIPDTTDTTPPSAPSGLSVS